jgi:hypothetical protein
MAISRQVSPPSLLGVSVGNCQRALADEARTIRIETGMRNRSEIVTVHGMPCTIPPHNSNSYVIVYIFLATCFGHRQLFLAFNCLHILHYR